MTRPLEKKMPKIDMCRILEINQSLSSIQGGCVQAKQQDSQHLQLSCSHTSTLSPLVALEVRKQQNKLYDACVYTCVRKKKMGSVTLWVVHAYMQVSKAQFCMYVVKSHVKVRYKDARVFLSQGTYGWEVVTETGQPPKAHRSIKLILRAYVFLRMGNNL